MREIAFANTLPGNEQLKVGSESTQSFGSWQSRGPWNIGGRTRALALDVSNPKIMVAGAVSGGVWRSTDEGSSWTISTKPEQLHSITSIAQDARQSHRNVWYCGTGEVYGNSAQISGNGIWKSIDSGKSWSVLTSTLSPVTPAGHSFAYAWRVIADTHANGDVYVATARSGIFRSRDGGTSWKSVAGSNALFSDIIQTTSGVFYAAFSAFTGNTGSIASRWGVYRSIDGDTWVNITPPEMNTSAKRIVLASVPQHPDRIMVLAETPGVGTRGKSTYRGQFLYEWHSLWLYDHSGGGWSHRSENIPLRPERRGDFYSQGGYDLFVSVSPHDSNLVIIGGTNVYRSLSGFRSSTATEWIGGYGKVSSTWDGYTAYPNHHPDQHDVVFHPTKPRVMYSANDGGVQRTDDVLAPDVTWTDLNRGYLTTQFYCLDQENKSGSPRIVGGMQDNATWGTDSSDGRTIWRRLGGGDGAYCYFADSGKTEYYSSQQGRNYRIRRDASGTEVDRSRIDPAGGSDYLFINPYVLHPREEHVCYLGGGSLLWRNKDLREIPAGINDSTFVNWDTIRSIGDDPGSISAICATSSTNGIDHSVYVGTTSGSIFRVDGAQTNQPVSTDVTSLSMTKWAMVNSISVNPSNVEHVVACFSNYGVISIWESTNSGGLWQPISGNLEENANGSGSGPAVNWVAMVSHGSGQTLYVTATSTGVYFTPQTRGMSTVWTQTAVAELGNVPCDMVVGRASDNQFAVATHGRGVFTGSITSLPPKPQTPVLYRPVDLSRGIHTDTTLTWHRAEGAISYEVRVWPAGSPDSVRVYAGVRDTSVSVRGLVQGPVEHNWTVESYSGGGGSGLSQQWAFSTAVRPPVLWSPAPGETNITEPTLYWERVPGAKTYSAEISTNAAFSVLVAQAQSIADTSYNLRGLENNKRYFWRCRSEDADTVGVISDRRSFVTGTVSSVDAVDADQTIRIEPNPASSNIKVHITDFVSGEIAEIEIVDNVGRMMSELKSEVSTITIPVTSLANGMYFIRIRVGTKLRTQNLIIRR